MNIDDDLKSAYEDGYEKGFADGFEAGQRDVQPDRKTSEWLHNLLQDAIDDGIITETQAVRIMERVKE